MQGSFLTSVTAVAVSATLGVSILAAAQTAPPMGGGYTNVIPIPVDDPNIKAIAGALFKPEGAGPFPGVVFMSGCAGLSPPPDMAMQKTVIDHLLAKGVAVLMVDPFTPRNEPEGICANLNGDTFVKYATRGGNDVAAALKVLKATLGVDPNRIFLQGYSWGAISSLFAMDRNTPSVHDARSRATRLLSLLLRQGGVLDADARSDGRQGRLDPGETMRGNQGQAESGSRCFSGRDPCLQCAIREADGLPRTSLRA